MVRRPLVVHRTHRRKFISSAVARAALLLIKPRCFLDEVDNRLCGHSQSCRAEMIAKKVEAVLDPADKRLSGCFSSLSIPSIAHTSELAE